MNTSASTVNGQLRDDHCQGFFCNGMSVSNPDDEPSESCECDCSYCERAKGKGEGMMEVSK